MIGRQAACTGSKNGLRGRVMLNLPVNMRDATMKT